MVSKKQTEISEKKVRYWLMLEVVLLPVSGFMLPVTSNL